MKLIVYHIFCVGDYQNIVKSQIEKVKKSGLYDWCDVMEITCVDTEEKFEGIDEIFHGMEKVNIFKTKLNAFEYWGIKKIWDIAQTNDGQVFYFHSKGVSNTYTNLITKEISEWKVQGINIWRNALEFHLIDNYQKCLEDLNGHDTCGMTCVGNWIWGNFWWANLSFVRENQDPVHGDRWYFEAWLHFARHYKTKEYHHFEWNPYFSDLPIEAYYNSEFFINKKVEIVSAHFGTIGIQQDEGYPSEIPVQQFDVTDKVIENFNNNNKEFINISVNTEILGEPIHGMRKFLVMLIKLDDIIYRITYNEGFTVGLKFN
jgi:hypothetical protein